MADGAEIAPVSRAGIALGLRENWQQFALLVLINAFVGGMVGLERTLVPLIGAETFRLASTAAVTSFIVSFGVVKAVTNLVSGQLADRWGRKKTLILGWASAFRCRSSSCGRRPGVGSSPPTRCSASTRGFHGR
jgi:MFS family permease